MRYGVAGVARFLPGSSGIRELWKIAQ